jgi:hypothetical protein
MLYIMAGNNDSGTNTHIRWRDDCMKEWTLGLYSGQYKGGWSWGTMFVKKHAVVVF